MSNFIAFILISVVFVLTGCKKSYIMRDGQTVLFQYEYINHAWGYQHSGFFIDSDGNVLTYDKPEGWNFADSENTISSTQLNNNLDKCTINDNTISSGELSKYSRHIENIASSKVSSPKSVGADFGAIRYYCYKYDEMTGSYKGFLIRMEGDYTCENLNYYSKKVASWMAEIASEIKKR